MAKEKTVPAAPAKTRHLRPKAKTPSAHRRAPSMVLLERTSIYEPEKVCGTRMAKGGVAQYQVKWKDWETKHNTWEPLEHLAGCVVRI